MFVTENPARGARLGVVSLVLSLFAAAVQQFGIGLESIYLDRNTLYHLIQAIASWLLYLSGKQLLLSTEQPIKRARKAAADFQANGRVAPAERVASTRSWIQRKLTGLSVST